MAAWPHFEAIGFTENLFAEVARFEEARWFVGFFHDLLQPVEFEGCDVMNVITFCFTIAPDDVERMAKTEREAPRLGRLVRFR